MKWQSWSGGFGFGSFCLLMALGGNKVVEKLGCLYINTCLLVCVWASVCDFYDCGDHVYG